MDAHAPSLWSHDRLLSCHGGGSPDDRHVFACLLVRGMAEAPLPLTAALGLGADQIERLVAVYFPGALAFLPPLPAGDGPTLALEEDDLRRLLLDHRAGAADEEVWLAQMVARRSLQPNHLWEDLGLHRRADLNGLITRHFPGLAAKNHGNMRWKKFLYRQLCEAEGLSICKSPVCSACADYAGCFLTAAPDRGN